MATESNDDQQQPSPGRSALYRARLKAARRSRPFTMIFAYLLPIPGALAVIFGDAVSQALTNLGAGTYSRLIGIMFLLGCSITVHAVATHRAVNECLGLVLTSVGLFLYGLGVIVGLLPLGGVVAGSISVAAGVGHIMAMFQFTALARYVHEHSEVRPDAASAP